MPNGDGNGEGTPFKNILEGVSPQSVANSIERSEKNLPIEISITLNQSVMTPSYYILIRKNGKQLISISRSSENNFVLLHYDNGGGGISMYEDLSARKVIDMCCEILEGESGSNTSIEKLKSNILFKKYLGLE